MQTIKYTRSQICKSIDPSDSENKILYEAFVDEITKKSVGFMEEFNMLEHVKSIESILKRIKRKNEEGKIITIKYHG